MQGFTLFFALMKNNKNCRAYECGHSNKYINICVESLYYITQKCGKKFHCSYVQFKGSTLCPRVEKLVPFVIRISRWSLFAGL